MNDDRITAPTGNETYAIGQWGRKHLSRREIMALIGTTGAAAVFGTLAANKAYGAACVEAIPEEMEGPLFVEEVLKRSDVRTDASDGSMMPGVPVTFTLQAYDLSKPDCAPLKGVHVDIWSCSSQGLYSDTPHDKTVGKKFLRGHQITDSKGNVKFTTIYPGWYHGRTAHIHVSLRTFNGERVAVAPLPTGCCTHTPNEVQKYVTQLYFPEPITVEVYKRPEYQRPGLTRDTTNANDGIFNRTKGATRGVLNLEKTKDGYQAKVVMGVSMKPAKDYLYNDQAKRVPKGA